VTTTVAVLGRQEARIFVDLNERSSGCERGHSVIVPSPAWQGRRKRRDPSWSRSAGKREREEAVPAWQVHDALRAGRSAGRDPCASFKPVGCHHTQVLDKRKRKDLAS
jgi:hypothetical protein